MTGDTAATPSRFIAEWCVRGWVNGEEPVYKSQVCATLEAAQAVSCAKAKAIGEEWARVEEQKKTRNGWERDSVWLMPSFGYWERQ